MKDKRIFRYCISFLLLTVLLCALFLWNMNSGSVDLSAKEIINIIKT